MLSKEEYTPIELREHCIKTMQFSNRNSNAYKEHELILSIMDENISMKYELDQLESDKQKLIDKLEKRRKQNNDRYGRAIDTDEFPEIYEYSGQVEEDDYLLSIVKGVENV